jgi:hypothetical protein
VLKIVPAVGEYSQRWHQDSQPAMAKLGITFSHNLWYFKVCFVLP